MTTESFILVAGFVLTIMGAIFTAFRHFTGQIEGVRRECALLIENGMESESKARHDAVNQIGKEMVRLQNHIENIGKDQTMMGQKMVERSDFKADIAALKADIKSDITQQVSTVKESVTDLRRDRSEQFERLSEQLNQMQMTMNGVRLQPRGNQ